MRARAPVPTVSTSNWGGTPPLAEITATTREASATGETAAPPDRTAAIGPTPAEGSADGTGNVNVGTGVDVGTAVDVAVGARAVGEGEAAAAVGWTVGDATSVGVCAGEGVPRQALASSDPASTARSLDRRAALALTRGPLSTGGPLPAP